MSCLTTGNQLCSRWMMIATALHPAHLCESLRPQGRTARRRLGHRLWLRRRLMRLRWGRLSGPLGRNRLRQPRLPVTHLCQFLQTAKNNSTRELPRNPSSTCIRTQQRILRCDTIDLLYPGKNKDHDTCSCGLSPESPAMNPELHAETGALHLGCNPEDTAGIPRMHTMECTLQYTLQYGVALLAGQVCQVQRDSALTQQVLAVRWFVVIVPSDTVDDFSSTC